MSIINNIQRAQKGENSESLLRRFFEATNNARLYHREGFKGIVQMDEFFKTTL